MVVPGELELAVGDPSAVEGACTRYGFGGHYIGQREAGSNESRGLRWQLWQLDPEDGPALWTVVSPDLAPVGSHDFPANG